MSRKFVEAYLAFKTMVEEHFTRPHPTHPTTSIMGPIPHEQRAVTTIYAANGRSMVMLGYELVDELLDSLDEGEGLTPIVAVKYLEQLENALKAQMEALKPETYERHWTVDQYIAVIKLLDREGYEMAITNSWASILPAVVARKPDVPIAALMVMEVDYGWVKERLKNLDTTTPTRH